MRKPKTVYVVVCNGGGLYVFTSCKKAQIFREMTANYDAKIRMRFNSDELALYKKLLTKELKHILTEWEWELAKHSFTSGWSACGKTVLREMKNVR